MSLIITDECIACDACREECPNYAIQETMEELKFKFKQLEEEEV